jgi:glycosyltransferase involved in cell wall biosynthesis
MLDLVRRYAVGLITTTDVARDAVLDTLEHNHKSLNVHSAHLPTAPVFLEPDGHDHILGSQEYFLVCGAIEPRKNHLMLLNVWQHLVQVRGAAAPRLVIAGSPAYRGRSILRQFEQCRVLSHSVVAISGLSSPGLRRLIAHARAMLTPSLAEGFGLPLAEALAVGTPVLASDLPAHREVGGHHPVYLDPRDEAGWFASISRMMDDPTYTAELRRCVANFQPVTAERYFANVQAFLEDIG